MTESVTQNANEKDLLTRVEEGMEVYDRDGHKVGTVKDVYAGEAVDGPPGGEPARGSAPLGVGAGSLVNDVARVFDSNLPEVLRSRLRHNGFIRMNGGLLRGDRYALREHVSAVDGRRVVLNVPAAELIKA